MSNSVSASCSYGLQQLVYVNTNQQENIANSVKSRRSQRYAKNPVLLEKLSSTPLEPNAKLPALSADLQNKVKGLFDKSRDLGPFHCSITEFFEAFNRAVESSPWAAKVRIDPQLELAGSTARQLLLADADFLERTLGNPTLSAITEAPMDLDLRCRICILGDSSVKECLEALGALIPLALQEVAKSQGKDLSIECIEKTLISKNQKNRAITILKEKKSFIMRAFGDVEFAIVHQIGRSFQFPADNLGIRWDGKEASAHCAEGKELHPFRGLREALCGAISLYQTDTMDFFCWPKLLCLIGRGQFPTGEDAEKVLMEKTKRYGKTDEQRRLAPRILKAIENHSPNKSCAYGALLAAVHSLHTMGETGATELWEEVAAGIERRDAFQQQPVPTIVKAFGDLIEYCGMDQGLDLLSLGLYLNLNAASGRVSRSQYFEKEALSYDMGQGSQVLLTIDPQAALERVCKWGLGDQEREAFLALARLLAPELPYVNGESCLGVRLSDASVELLGADFYFLQRGQEGPSDLLPSWVKVDELMGVRAATWAKALSPYGDLRGAQAEIDVLLALAKSRSKVLREWALKKGAHISPKILLAINSVAPEHCLHLLANDKLRTSLKDQCLYRLLKPLVKSQQRAVYEGLKALWPKIPDRVQWELVKEAPTERLELIAYSPWRQWELKRRQEAVRILSKRGLLPELRKSIALSCVEERVQRLSQQRFPDEKRLSRTLAVMSELKVDDPGLWSLLLKTLADTHNSKLKAKALDAFLRQANNWDNTGNEQVRSILLQLIKQSSQIPAVLREQFLDQRGAIVRLFAGDAAALQRAELEDLLLGELEETNAWPKEAVDLNYLLELLSKQPRERQLRWVLACPKEQTAFIQHLGKQLLLHSKAAKNLLPARPTGRRWQNCRSLLTRVDQPEAETLQRAMDQLCVETGEIAGLSNVALKAPQTLVSKKQQAYKLMEQLLRHRQFKSAVTLICQFPLPDAYESRELEKALNPERATYLARALIQAKQASWPFCTVLAHSSWKQTMELVQTLGGVDGIGRTAFVKLLQSSKKAQLQRELGSLLFGSLEETRKTFAQVKCSPTEHFALAANRHLDAKQRNHILNHQAEILSQAKTPSAASKALSTLYGLIERFPHWDYRPYLGDLCRWTDVSAPYPQILTQHFFKANSPLQRLCKNGELWIQTFFRVGFELAKGRKSSKNYETQLRIMDKLVDQHCKLYGEEARDDLESFLLRCRIIAAVPKELKKYVLALKERDLAAKIPRKQLINALIEVHDKLWRSATAFSRASTWADLWAIYLSILQDGKAIATRGNVQEFLSLACQLATTERFTLRVTVTHAALAWVKRNWEDNSLTDQDLKEHQTKLDSVLSIGKKALFRYDTGHALYFAFHIWEEGLRKGLLSKKSLLEGLKTLAAQAIFFGSEEDLRKIANMYRAWVSARTEPQTQQRLSVELTVVFHLLDRLPLQVEQKKQVEADKRVLADACGCQAWDDERMQSYALAFLATHFVQLNKAAPPARERLKLLLDFAGRVARRWSPSVADNYFISFHYKTLPKLYPDMVDLDGCHEVAARQQNKSLEDLYLKILTGAVFDFSETGGVEAGKLLTLPLTTFAAALQRSGLKHQLATLMACVDAWERMLRVSEIREKRDILEATARAITSCISVYLLTTPKHRLADSFNLAYYLVLSFKQLKIETLGANRELRELGKELKKLIQFLVAALQTRVGQSLLDEERLPALLAIQLIKDTWLSRKKRVAKFISPKDVQGLLAPIARMRARLARSLAEKGPFLELGWLTMQMMRFFKHLEREASKGKVSFESDYWTKGYSKHMTKYMKQKPDARYRRAIYKSLKDVTLSARQFDDEDLDTTLHNLAASLCMSIPRQQRETDPLTAKIARLRGEKVPALIELCDIYVKAIKEIDLVSLVKSVQEEQVRSIGERLSSRSSSSSSHK